MARSAYSLKFIAGKYLGGEYALPEDEDTTIGRASDLEMVLIEDLVSRKHAKITCRSGEVWLKDLGSTNGTYVNGERIRKVKLKSGDRILIGTSILKLINRTQSAQSGMQALENSREKSPAEVNQALAGRLGDITLSELLPLLSASRKDGVLVIRRHQERARMVLREGRVIHCAIADRPNLDPRKCFYRLLTWESGSFELQKTSDEQVAHPIQQSTEALLLEGVRQLDELRHITPELPKLDDLLLIQKPILPPLRNLTRELLDTLQIVHNCGKVDAILDASAASDLDTYQELLYLLNNRYIRKLERPGGVA